MDIKIDGLQDLIEKLKANQGKLRGVIGKEMYQFAEEVMTASKQIVPVKTGALMNTGKVMPPVDDGSTVTVDLGYGDESVDYAIYVHEELHSPKGNPINYTRPGSGPKFLQSPFDQMSDQLPPRIQKAIEEAFKE